MNIRNVTNIAVALLGILSAAPDKASALFNNRMAVQGYLKYGTSGMSGTYAMQIILKKNSTAVWTKSYPSISVSGGVFSQVLSGNDDSGSPVPMSANLFNHAANSDTFTVDVKVDVDANGIGTGTDAIFSGIDLVPVPLAMTANTATSLSQNGATSGQYLMWNGSSWAPSTLSTSTIPASAVGASQLSSGAVDLSTSTVTGVLPISGGGTGLSTAPTNNSLLMGNGSGYTQLAAPAANKVLTSDGSGNIVWGTAAGGGASLSVANTWTAAQTFPAGTAAAPGVIVGTAGNGLVAPAANNVAISTSGSAKLTVGTGVTVNTGGLTVTAGGLNVAAGGATIGAGDLTVSSGNISMPAASSVTSAGNLTVAAATGSSTTIGSSTGASTTNIQGGSGGVNITGGMAVGTTITGGADVMNMRICKSGAGTGPAGSVSAQSGKTFTIACAGAAVGSAVYCSPNSATNAALTWVSYISTANTITVSVANVSTGNLSVSSTWTCLVAN